MSFTKDFNAKTADIRVSWQEQKPVADIAESALVVVEVAPLCAGLCFGTRHCGKTAALCLPGVQDDVPIPVVITAYEDKTFDYVSYKWAFQSERPVLLPAFLQGQAS